MTGIDKHAERNGSGILYVVATPIGNLEDITFRAVRVLGEVDLIAAEDTRHTKKLLSHFGLKKPLVSYYKDREAARTGKIIDELLAGRNVALVSDAGTPAVSDPGAVLVGACRARGIVVTPIPGPSALTALLSVAGRRESSFHFFGFLPSQQGKRRKLLQSVASAPQVLIFYESPRRIVKSLRDCLDILGERSCLCGRELTKIHEEVIEGKISELIVTLTDRPEIKGEFVCLVEGGRQDAPVESTDLDELLTWHRDHSGFSLKESVQSLARELDLPRSRVYKRALAIWKEKRGERHEGG